MPRLTVERAPRVTVEHVQDIDRRLTVSDGFHYPRTDQDVPQALVDEGVILADTLPAFLEVARFHNGMVHVCARIGDATCTISSRGDQTTSMPSPRLFRHTWKGSEVAPSRRGGSG